MAQEPTAAFTVGQPVMHAKHGLGKIVSIEDQTYAGIALSCYVITFERDKLTMRIPLTGSGVDDLRAVSGDGSLAKIVKILSGAPKHGKPIWGQRVRDLNEKLHSGVMTDLAEVVRDLHVGLDVERSYSATEIYEEALQRLIAEVALMRNTSEAEAAAYLSKESSKTFTVRTGPTPVHISGVTPSLFDPARHQEAARPRPPSAMEERLAARLPHKATPPPKTVALPRVVKVTAAPKPSEAARPKMAKTEPPATPVVSPPEVKAPPPARPITPRVTPRPTASTPPKTTRDTLQAKSVGAKPPTERPRPFVPVPRIVMPAPPVPSVEDVATIVRLEAELAEARTSKDALITVNRTWEERYEASEAARKAAENRVEILARKLAQAEADAEGVLQAHQETVAHLKETLTERDGKVAELEQSLAKQRVIVASEELLHGELATVRETLATIRTELREAKRLIKAAERREEKLRDKLKAAQRKLKMFVAPEVVVSLVEAQVAETVAELEATKAALAEAKLTQAEVLGNIAQVRRELLKLIAKSPASLVKLKQQLETLKAENAALRERLGEA